jgi:hypothetical protein
VVLRGEVRCEETHGRLRHRARHEQVEDDGETPAGAGDGHAVAGGVFGKAQALGAITKEGSMALGGVQGGAGIQHGQVGDELGRGLALP